MRQAWKGTAALTTLADNNTAPPGPTHGGFIASVEGMRALAVLAVLLFHLQVPGFDGGFLGVDLFFVISGFIITRNILFDVARDRFRLGEFYLRRFRRLFPALLVTVLLTLLAGLALLPPQELANTARSAVFALVSLANFNFWVEAGYFDAAAHSKPLLHTWSLSVEEQFYLFWPALLLLVASPRWRLPGIVLLLCASVAITLVWMSRAADAVFYLLPFRVHQLMAGALVAVIASALSGMAAAAVAAAACAAFVLLCTVLAAGTSPALGALGVSLVGCAMLLARQGRIAHLLFAGAAMQWVGRRSYAIYLVHWPLIVLYGYHADFALDTADRVLLAVATFLAAALLHVAVELPFRKRGEDVTALQRSATPLFLLLLAGVTVFAGTTWYQDGYRGRADSGIARIVESAEHEQLLRRDAIRWGQCNLHRMHSFADYDPAACAEPDPQGPDAIVIGDSIAADTYMALAHAYPDVRILQATAGACTAVLELDSDNAYPACAELNAFRFDALLQRDFDLVILSAIWTPQRVEPLVDTVRHLQRHGKRVLVIGPRAVFPGFVPLLASTQDSPEGLNEKLAARMLRKDDLLGSIRQALPGVEVIDIGAVQCEPACDALEGERLLYFDAQHWTVLGAQRMGERLAQRFDLRAYIESVP